MDIGRWWEGTGWGGGAVGITSRTISISIPPPPGDDSYGLWPSGVVIGERQTILQQIEKPTAVTKEIVGCRSFFSAPPSAIGQQSKNGFVINQPFAHYNATWP